MALRKVSHINNQYASKSELSNNIFGQIPHRISIKSCENLHGTRGKVFVCNLR